MELLLVVTFTVAPGTTLFAAFTATTVILLLSTPSLRIEGFSKKIAKPVTVNVAVAAGSTTAVIVFVFVVDVGVVVPAGVPGLPPPPPQPTSAASSKLLIKLSAFLTLIYFIKLMFRS